MRPTSPGTTRLTGTPGWRCVTTSAERRSSIRTIIGGNRSNARFEISDWIRSTRWKWAWSDHLRRLGKYSRRPKLAPAPDDQIDRDRAVIMPIGQIIEGPGDIAHCRLCAEVVRQNAVLEDHSHAAGGLPRNINIIHCRIPRSDRADQGRAGDKAKNECSGAESIGNYPPKSTAIRSGWP